MKKEKDFKDKNIDHKNKKTDGTLIKLFEMVIYLIIVHGSYLFLLVADFNESYDSKNIDSYLDSVLLISLFTIGILLFTDALNTAKKSKEENFVIMLIYVVLVAFGTMAAVFFGRGFAMPRSVILLGMVLQLILSLSTKFLILYTINYRRKKKSIAIIGTQDEKEVLFSKIMTTNPYGDLMKYYIFLDDFDIDKISAYLYKVDKIYISDLACPEVMNLLVNFCISNQIQMNFVPKTYEIAVNNSKIHFASDVPILKMNDLTLPWEKMFIKRIMDIVISLLGLIVLSPVMLSVALVLFIKEGSPVVFKQERVTRDNQVFTLYKFRTMVNNAEKDTGAIWSTTDDPRITKLGKTLRKYWLDETLQLVNVLKGDMSMVGPRPERPEFIDEFAKNIPDFKYRVNVKAGVTGYAQIQGKYNTKPENKLKFDLFYIQNSSVLFDLTLLLETVKKVIMGTLKRGDNKEKSYHDILDINEIKKVYYSEDGLLIYE